MPPMISAATSLRDSVGGIACAAAVKKCRARWHSCASSLRTAGRHDTGGKRLLGHAKLRQIFLRQIDAALLQIGLDVANDVGHLQRQAEVEGVLARARIAAAEHLDAHHADRRRHAAAIADQLIEGVVARAMQIHLDAVDEIVERLARQRERRDVRLEIAAPAASAAAPRQTAGRLPRATSSLRPPAVAGSDRLIHRIVDGAAEIPDRANARGAAPAGRTTNE